MSRIQRYFNSLAQQISHEAQRAGTSSHRPDIGTNREVIVHRFFRNHLPKRLTPTIGGNILGAGGDESNQIDIVVSSDVAVRFDEDERTFTTAEGVAAAVTVKSVLDKTSLNDCLMNLASIPQAHSSILTYKALRPGSFDLFVEKYPSLYVFAFEGIQPQRCFDYVVDFYRQHPEIPTNRYPSGITVNCSYFIGYFKVDTTTSTGDIIKAGTFQLSELEDAMHGYPFVQMLNNIASYTSWLAYLDIDIHHYFNTGYGLP